MNGLCVVVSGGGEAALDTALNAFDRGAKVEIHFRNATVRGNEALRIAVNAAGLPRYSGHGLAGVERIPGGLRARFTHGRGGELHVECDHLIICHGREPDRALWRMVAGRETPLPSDVPTGIEGLFCAGDLVRGGCRYASVAAGDGTRAGHLAGEYLLRKGKF